MDSALGGLRVLELASGIAGPMAAMLLADFGAEVVKVEPPEGDPERARPGFLMWGRGKTSVVLDPGSDRDQERLAALLAGADVLVASPAAAASWPAASPQRAAAAHRRLICLDLPPFLDSAPWFGGRESGSLLSAAMGTSLRQSSSDGGPVDPVYPHLLYIQACWAACCCVAALIEREGSGAGQVVTVGGVHGTMAASPLQMVVRPGEPEHSSAVGPGGHSPTYTRYQCADGQWVFLAALTPKFQEIALRVLGFADLLDRAAAEGLETVIGPLARAQVRPRFEAAFASKSASDWLAAFKEAGCPVALLADREDWLDHPQIQAIGMSVTVPDPDRGPVTMPGNPVWLSETPARPPVPAPPLGPPDAELPAWPGASGPAGQAPDGRAPDGVSAAKGGPLAGVRVADIGVVLAGPYAGTLLAELGAEVIKVEIPAGDSFRRHGFPYIRGQRGLALNLRSPRGLAIFTELARSADVVIENYRPGVSDRLGVGYQQLRGLRPDIVSMSIRAFGDRGPLRDEPGFDTVLQAMSGFMTAQGGSGEPVMLSLAVNDTATATLAAFGICVALLYRARTGKGQQGSVSLAGTSAFLQSEELIRVAGRSAPITGGPDFRGPGATDRFYATTDGWIRVQAADPAEQAALLELAGLAGSAAGADDDALAGALASYFSGQQAADVCARLEAAGVPATRARPTSELPRDPQFQRFAIHQRISSGLGGELLAAGRMARFSRTEREDALVPPGVGEHSEQVLAEIGLSAAEIEQAISEGVVRTGDPMVIAAVAPYR
jgi:crotonobetainyl-CoA:carnitine CoA-transferase CaiB-like acyl-CoA transferase